VPSQADLPVRLDTVLHVIYLVFNEEEPERRFLERRLRDLLD
jgi:predicted RNA polymerase sigma factor